MKNQIVELKKQIKNLKQRKQQINEKITILKEKYYNINNQNNLNNLNKEVDNLNNFQNEPINILDIGNYIVEKTREYPYFLRAKNKNDRKNPRHGLFILDNYCLSTMIYYVYVTSLLQKKPLFRNELLVAARHGTIFPTVLDNYIATSGYRITKISPDGNSKKLNSETKKMIDNIVERISQTKDRKEYIDINRQQRAYFQARFPLEKMKKIMKEKLKGKKKIDELEFADINDVRKKIITDELIIKSFEGKEDIFSIDEDCRYECVPEGFFHGSADYLPKGVKIMSHFRFTQL